MNRCQSSFFHRTWLIQSHDEDKYKQTFTDPINPKFSVTHDVSKMKGKLPFGCFGKHLFLWDKKKERCSFLNLASMSEERCSFLDQASMSEERCSFLNQASMSKERCSFLDQASMSKERCSFLDQASMSEILLPPLPVEFHYIGNFSVSSSLDSHDCIIFAFGIGLGNPTFILFCHPNDKEWTKLPIDLCNDHVGWMIMVHEEKLYAFSFVAVVVFDVPSLLVGNAEKRKIIETAEFPHYPITNTGRKHLVESCGDIFYIRTQQDGPCGPLIYMHIYRLDISIEEIWKNNDNIIDEDVWKRVYTIDDRAFFLEGTRGISVCAKDVGVQCNCVYFVLECYGEVRLCKFCLDDQTFSFNFLSDETMCRSAFSWILPIKCQSMRENISKTSSNLANLTLNDEVNQEEEEEEEATVDVYRPWCDLTIDVFQFILRHLSLVDAARLRTVCKAWSPIPDPFANAETWPWLMSRGKINGTYSFLDPLYSTLHTSKIDELSWNENENENENECVVMICAKDGWIVTLLDNYTILILNPFFPDKNQFFPPLLETNLDGMTLSSVPTSPDCIVFGIASSLRGDAVTIFLWNPETDKETWDTMEFENGVEFRPASSNPVFFRGEFYCLEHTGMLGVFNPINKSWKVHPHDPQQFYQGDDYDIKGTANCYLLELQGDLICVHKLNKNAAISIFKLDQPNMTWCKLKDIGDTTIFLDFRSSLAKILPGKSRANKIFFPAFDPNSNKCAFYCVETQTHTTNKLYELKEPMDCVWLEPNFRKYGF